MSKNYIVHDYTIMFEKLFTRTGLSLERLRTFCEIAEARGISKAAKRKPHGQSQFSRQLKDLEEYFEVELFERRGKGIHITDAGKRLMALSKEFFTTLEVMSDEFRNLPKTVAIGAGESVLDWLILPKFEQLEQILPNTRIMLVNLRSHAVNTGVLEGELDFGIVRQNACSKRLGTLKLGILNYCLFVPRKMHTAARTSDPVELLKKLPLAQLHGDGEFNEMLAKVADQKSITLKTRLICSSFPSMKEAVKRGRVAAVLPSIAATDLPRSDFEQMSVPLFSPLNREFVLCFSKRVMTVRAYDNRCLEKLAKLFAIA